ncbi:MAG: hypothetical protein FJZ00_02205, partial [Candidatus Sericytochromatia bacterium]|nr:hypothetical protein [Candidatus Tanganyikabacteria bacterium]
DKPSVDFVVDAADVADLKALIRKEVPDSFIGTKDLGDGEVFVTVTGFARKPQALAVLGQIAERYQDKADLSGEKPAETSIAALIEKVKQAKEQG